MSASTPSSASEHPDLASAKGVSKRCDFNEPLDLTSFVATPAQSDESVEISVATSSSSSRPEAAQSGLAVFDMDAAWLRRAEADGAAFLSRFARIVVEALPQHASLETMRRGVFRRTEEIVGVIIAFDDDTYRMRLSNRQQIVTEIEKRVRGVVLSTKSTPASAWLSGLLLKIHERTRDTKDLADLLRTL